MERPSPRNLLVAVVAALVTAGCAGEEPQDDLRGGLARVDEPSPRASASPPSPSAGGAESETPPPARLEIVDRLEQGVSVGIPCPTRPGAFDCAAGNLRSKRIEVPWGAPTRAVLTAEWTANTEVSETLRISFKANREDAPESTVTSTSPLTLDIPPEAIASPGEYRIAVRPDTPGATFQEVVGFVLALDYA